VVANRFVELLTSNRPWGALFVLIDPEYGAGALVIGPEDGVWIVVVVGPENWVGYGVDGVPYGPGVVFTPYRPPCCTATTGAVSRTAMAPIVAAFAICWNMHIVFLLRKIL